VPFEGSAQVNAAILGGHVDMGYGACSADGLRKLAQTGAARTSFDADTPTLTELGYNSVATQWRGFTVKAGTDPEIVATLADLFVEAAADSRFVEFMESRGEVLNVFESEEFAAQVREDVEATKALRARLGL